MKIGYTEFSFGYAFTENLIRSSSAGPTNAPVFPNLIQEASAGYDVRIDFPACLLFFQYKLPELMCRNSAAEIAKHALPGICTPFFRMPVMRRDLSDQHRLLYELEGQNPGAVYYATPDMQNITTFNAAYKTANVHRRSVFFSPRNMGLLTDDKQHIVAYRAGQTHAWLCSEPKEVQPLTYGDIESKVRDQFEHPEHESVERAAGHVRESVRSLVSREIRDSEGDIRERVRGRRRAFLEGRDVFPRVVEVVEELAVTREMARIGLGLDMVVAQPRPGSA